MKFYNRENLIGPLLVRNILGPRPPPPPFLMLAWPRVALHFSSGTESCAFTGAEWAALHPDALGYPMSAAWLQVDDSRAKLCCSVRTRPF